MRDFLPEDVRRRGHVIGVITRVYERYGFEPLETPAVENIETLMGKYGEEGNQLIFKSFEIDERKAPQIKALIDEFAAGLKENRTESLRALFIGTLQRVNAERRQVMGGIKRYARRQAALADQIRAKSLEEASLTRQSPLTDENRLLEEVAEHSAKVVDWLTTRHYTPFSAATAFPANLGETELNQMRVQTPTPNTKVV